jgi:hypothetical protein
LTSSQGHVPTSAVKGAKSAKARYKSNLQFFELRGEHSYKSVCFVRFFGEAQKMRGARRRAPDEIFYIQVQFIIKFKFNMILKYLVFLI